MLKQKAPKGHSNRKSRKAASRVINPETRTPCEETPFCCFETVGEDALQLILMLETRLHPEEIDSIISGKPYNRAAGYTAPDGGDETMVYGYCGECGQSFFRVYKGTLTKKQVEAIVGSKMTDWEVCA